VLASLAGAQHIIVIDGNEQRLAIAASLGATLTISMDGTAEDRRRQVFDVTGLAGPNLVVEAAGALPALQEGLELVGTRGSFLIMGVWGDVGVYPLPVGIFGWRNVTLYGYTFSKPKHYYAALQLAVRLQDRLPLAELVTHRFGIDDAARAIAFVKAGGAVKAVIDPSIG
jgi:threonine dehydrogenase-like Zn-dependent dehydrogenase